jgi:hypothetical protein
MARAWTQAGVGVSELEVLDAVLVQVGAGGIGQAAGVGYGVVRGLRELAGADGELDRRLRRVEGFRALLRVADHLQVVGGRVHRADREERQHDEHDEGDEQRGATLAMMAAVHIGLSLR